MQLLVWVTICLFEIFLEALLSCLPSNPIIGWRRSEELVRKDFYDKYSGTRASNLNPTR